MGSKVMRIGVWLVRQKERVNWENIEVDGIIIFKSSSERYWDV
jgi:hypothetical protein